MASVRRARLSDSRAIARLHRRVISWALLAQFGEDVVTAFYRAITDSPDAFCFLAEEDGDVVGFAAGVEHWPRFQIQVLRATWWPLLRATPRMFQANRWRRLLETRQYTQSKHEGVNAEFLSFGVREDAPGRIWVGVALARAVVGEFRRRGVPRIRGVVWDKNERALQFFRAVGFEFVSQVEIHPGENSRAFVMDVLPGRSHASC